MVPDPHGRATATRASLTHVGTDPRKCVRVYARAASRCSIDAWRLSIRKRRLVLFEWWRHQRTWQRSFALILVRRRGRSLSLVRALYVGIVGENSLPAPLRIHHSVLCHHVRSHPSEQAMPLSPPRSPKQSSCPERPPRTRQFVVACRPWQPREREIESPGKDAQQPRMRWSKRAPAHSEAGHGGEADSEGAHQGRVCVQ